MSDSVSLSLLARPPVCRPEISGLPRYNAGLSEDEVRRRYGLKNIVKLGSNENPYGPSPHVIAGWAASGARLGRYPDAAAAALRHDIARVNGLASDRVLVGNGSEQIIRLIAEAYLSPGERVVTVRPAFGLHEIYPRMMGAEVDAVPINLDATFDLAALHTAVKQPTKILMFANPSNPVGCMMSGIALQDLIDACPSHTLIVVDEAYREYAEEDSDYPDARAILEKQSRPWVILRTFSKAYALAALRIGYALTSCVDVAMVLDTVRDPFNTNMPAQVAARAALADDAYMKDCIRKTVSERKRVADALNALGLFVAPTWTNFVFVRVPVRSDLLATDLLKRGIIIKPWKEKGFENWVRISIGLPNENDTVLKAIADLVLS
ncbi:histidinol-phosphate aminotransferase [Acetobacter tropicalis]|uniref:Histidinol-phosphate aminotransferase n=1 Tax=Acetobacter tropicalis TaxID=104102 RepID=A0A149U1Y0_9PROT|nr:histidinol-phosphate transaminase [Acetobacter tropicalis]KXV59431.1 histidinol-phosphate aminotransferase [Acetobacter tropicalis]